MTLDWQRVKAVFQDALVRPADARGPFLDDACGGDAALRREVDSLLAAHADAGGFLSAPAIEVSATPASEPEMPDRIGPYRVLGLIARGGMGAVYRAVRDDDAFEKTVALKLVRGGHSPELLERRFRQERRILARLQHPNIATILDGGATGQGHPYLVMEYVEGEPIDRWCDARGLRTRDRLALMARVCGAVHYAHQSLVVHRDLKPQNILVTADGQPKLLDFGIAKLLADDTGPDGLPTATIVPMMTPEYASPEQVRGEPVTTLSDVYSLGVVLYELLCGQRPYTIQGRSLEDIVRAVAVTEPAAPSVAAARTTRGSSPASELRGDLDTIVLKALRKEPQRRYQSAQELAEDLERHLAGLTVRARRDTLRYRAGKFVARNRVAVIAVALVAASLVGGLFATLRQARIAEANRARAERRFADVRRLAGSFLFEFHDAIQGLPGATPARALVVKRALEYLDGLSQEAGDDVPLRRELAAAYQRVADVQGNPYGPNLGDTAGAIASSRKEVAIREALAAGADRQEALDLVAAYRRLGLLEDEGGQTEAGAADLKRALDLAERLHADDPQEERGRRVLADVLDGAALLALKAGDPKTAEVRQRRALAIWQAEVAARPEDQQALRGVFVVNGDLARTLRVTGRVPEAVERYRDALRWAERRQALAPADLLARRDVSIGNTNLAVALYAQKDYAGAVPLLRKSLAFDEEVLRADPRNSQAQRDVNWDLGFLAELSAEQGRLEEALAYQRRALAGDEARAAAAPGSFQAQKDLAESWSAAGEYLRQLERWSAARDASERALSRFEALGAANPGQVRVKQLLAAQYARHGAILDGSAARPGREACAAYGRSLDLWSSLEKGGAVIDEEHRARRADAERAAARCTW
jgi:non-specific serine/threonine protein kinase/serine/threonine-protein kinase